MANPKKRVPENIPGDFFVDSTCINCDACRQIAPSVFGEAAETSFVKAQPAGSAHRRHALQALLACPTGSIGCLGDDDVKAVLSGMLTPETREKFLGNAEVLEVFTISKVGKVAGCRVTP